MTTSTVTSPSAAPLEFDRRRADGRGIADSARAFSTAAKLGWQMEANWTDPLLFFIYSVAKPIASALILVFMLLVIAGPGADEARAFVVVGSALWAFVMSGMAGLAWSVLDDRERYRMLKYIYVSPSDFKVVLMGRGVARIAIGAMGAIIVLVVGVLFLGVPFTIQSVEWLFLAHRPRHRADGHHRHRHRAGGRLPPDPPGVVVLPRGGGGRHVPGRGRRLPARRAAHAGPGHRPRGAPDLVAGGRPTGRLRGQPDGHRWPGLALDQPDGHGCA